MSTEAGAGQAPARRSQRVAEVFLVFLRLGLTSFGGPIAHLGYFRQQFVERRGWLSEQAYADLVALCQFLPGPASSQVGIAVGLKRAGLAGALAAWLGFTLPSALIMIAFAYGFRVGGLSAGAGWIQGLKLAAVAVVTQAVWRMGQQLCPDRARASIAVLAALAVLAFSGAWSQIAAIALGALLGAAYLKAVQTPGAAAVEIAVGRRAAHLAWLLFFVVLAGLPLLAWLLDSHGLRMIDSFYRSGALVFGGGHVVLPLLRTATVEHGWLADDVFLAGYGVAQALPGPLFAFAAYLGAVLGPPPNGWLGAAIALLAIFAPAFLLVVGALPLWTRLRGRRAMRSAFDGINAAVVGILLAALYDPIFITAVRSPADFALVLAAFGLLAFWRLSPVWIVLFCAIGGALLAA